ncbi:hypothetical protein V4V35_18690 [Bacillus infantis]|uniref:hypothetical protein n=1 Tax=Bacillus infantis TaxID=324767 RepID=UPI002FBEB269
MYRYDSPVGPMAIAVDKRVNKYALIINDSVYGHYQSAVAAADDVYCHATGCYEWDKLDGKFTDAPTDLYEWDRIR